MLSTTHLSVSYGGRFVLSGIDLEVRGGQVVVLVGPNGAGKTTLVRTLNATVTPVSGAITFDDLPLGRLSRRKIAENIAVVAQENETRFPVTVIEFVLSGRFTHGGAFGWETPDDLAAAKAALQDCDLAGYGSRLMNHLSGGERQRVVLARALATGAKLLLLDEPTANLDLAHQAMMFRLVRARCDTDGASAVVITHDLNLAAEFADTVVMLHDGQVHAQGPPAKVLTTENIASVFGVKVLLDANPATGNVRVTNVF